MKGCTITNDSDKIYFYTDKGNVYAELNDRETPNINNITYLVTSDYEGEDIGTPFPMKLDSVRMISGLKCSKITVRYNNKLKISIFEVEEDGVLIKFIISALVK